MFLFAKELKSKVKDKTHNHHNALDRQLCTRPTRFPFAVAADAVARMCVWPSFICRCLCSAIKLIQFLELFVREWNKFSFKNKISALLSPAVRQMCTASKTLSKICHANRANAVGANKLAHENTFSMLNAHML